MSFVLTSPEFRDGDTLPSSYQADRDNQSPALAWQGAPEGTRSFAVAMHDPDATTSMAAFVVLSHVIGQARLTAYYAR